MARCSRWAGLYSPEISGEYVPSGYASWLGTSVAPCACVSGAMGSVGAAGGGGAGVRFCGSFSSVWSGAAAARSEDSNPCFALVIASSGSLIASFTCDSRPALASLNLRRPLPKLWASSGIFFGPKKIRITSKIRRISPPPTFSNISQVTSG